jgi:tetratricopeptide (TPR) repeat protein
VSEEETVRILRRDMLLLSVIAACAVGLFLVTKVVAAREGEIESRVATIWYQDGERKLSSGKIDEAIDSFRKATGIDRENRRYVMALADALAAGNHNIEAQQALLRLREQDPTNAEINLRLARLAAKSGDVSEAVLYYHSSLDGMWKGSDVASRRRSVRKELIDFLIARKDQDRALSELLVLDSELPQIADAHVQTAKLYLQVNDAQRALNDFIEAVRLDPLNDEALAGAGETELRLGDRRKARQYLEQAVARGDASPQTRELLRQIEQQGQTETPGETR